MPSSNTQRALKAVRENVRDINFDLRSYVADILPYDAALPLSEIAAQFESRCIEEGRAKSRYEGRAISVARQLLRELEADGRANRQAYTTTAATLTDPLWGGPGFKPARRNPIAERSASIRRKRECRERIAAAPTAPAEVEVAPDPKITDLLRELAQLRGQINHLEAQVLAMQHMGARA